MIKYAHLKTADHPVRLAVPSPNTSARFCDQCHAQVIRTKAGRPVR